VKRHLLTLAAIVAFAGLVAAVVVVAVSSASGTPGGSVLGAPSPRGGPQVRHLPPPACSFEIADGPSAIPVSGACRGRLTGEFRCVKSEELFSLSIRRPLGKGNVFYLTVLIPDYTGPGGYPESEAFISIIGPADPPRWTRRDAITAVSPEGFVELGTFLFKPEPGTPASGKILLTGRAACAKPDRGLVAVTKKH
jgi:hypothetical protein